MKLEVLHVPECPNLPLMLERLAEATELPVVTRVIESEADAERFGMAGSPTLLVDGVDPFAGDGECGVFCRLYGDEDGRIVAVPSVDELRAALGPAPLGAAERAEHRRILRAFATMGRPPAPGATARSLDDADLIRLTSYGEIAAAYPFSATPTRHRVRIDGRVEVHAMCAIDALGIAPMLGQDTVIESADATTGEPITVITRQGRSTWDPAGAVVFVGGRASVDCWCDYLNFFADRETAETWMRAHPDVPGRVLDQQEAEERAARHFGHLLATDNNSP